MTTDEFVSWLDQYTLDVVFQDGPQLKAKLDELRRIKREVVPTSTVEELRYWIATESMFAQIDRANAGAVVHMTAGDLQSLGHHAASARLSAAAGFGLPASPEY